MTIHLYGSPLSTCTRRVAVIAKELKIEYVLHSVDLTKGEQKAAAFVEHQPFGQVPYIVDDANGNFELYESRAIAKYLVRQYGAQSGLLPGEDVKKWAKFEQAASVEVSNFDAHAATIAFEKIFGPRRGIPTNEANLEKHINLLNAKLDVYEVLLGKSKYLAGDEVTLADLFHLPYGYAISGIGFGDALVGDKRPNVARWWKDISSRPAWLAVKDGA